MFMQVRVKLYCSEKTSAICSVWLNFVDFFPVSLLWQTKLYKCNNGSMRIKPDYFSFLNNFSDM